MLKFRIEKNGNIKRFSDVPSCVCSARCLQIRQTFSLSKIFRVCIHFKIDTEERNLLGSECQRGKNLIAHLQRQMNFLLRQSTHLRPPRAYYMPFLNTGDQCSLNILIYSIIFWHFKTYIYIIHFIIYIHNTFRCSYILYRWVGDFCCVMYHFPSKHKALGSALRSLVKTVSLYT